MTQIEPSSATRLLATRPRGEVELKVATISRTYDTTAEDLWDAVTSAERLPRWFLPVSGELREGGRYQFEGNAGGTVQTCAPPHQFSATWEFGGQVSWVQVRISPDGDGARLELEHTAEIDPANVEQQQFWTQFGPGATGVGWDLALRGLALHLDSGEALDPAAYQAWTVSTEGAAFVAECSRLWGEASIAEGTARADAEAAAARTTAFYTGQPDPTAPQGEAPHQEG
ncbi:SRPBCC family protein [Ornithinimicrobium murale]|uniref:SRPBCC family protein n=1 Tax=Ornithinimicrobium murale TaxID=1050153 RepID=UPI000E0DA0A1|nr:SRPBCC family protein [Ornithinimicrobium murale]